MDYTDIHIDTDIDTVMDSCTEKETDTGKGIDRHRHRQRYRY